MSEVFDTPGIRNLLRRVTEVEGLQEEVRTHITAINQLFARISGALNGTAASHPGNPRQGRRRRLNSGRRGYRRRRAKRGALRAAIHQVLAAGKVLKPAEVVKALPKAGIKNPSYASVYTALKTDKGIQKTAQGFRLKKAGSKEKK